MGTLYRGSLQKNAMKYLGIRQVEATMQRRRVQFRDLRATRRDSEMFMSGKSVLDPCKGTKWESDCT